MSKNRLHSVYTFILLYIALPTWIASGLLGIILGAIYRWGGGDEGIPFAKIHIETGSILSWIYTFESIFLFVMLIGWGVFFGMLIFGAVIEYLAKRSSMLSKINRDHIQ